MHCRKCLSDLVVRNGCVRGKQRYRCNTCNYNFVEIDGRGRPNDAPKRALAVILYTMSKATFNFLGKLFKVSPSTAMNWIKRAGLEAKDPDISEDIREIEFDEMWHFLYSKKTKNGYSKRLIAAQGELLPGLRATVILQHLNDYTTN
jgi:transposase-like protein